jgi:hypothetical protein
MERGSGTHSVGRGQLRPPIGQRACQFGQAGVPGLGRKLVVIQEREDREGSEESRLK